MTDKNKMSARKAEIKVGVLGTRGFPNVQGGVETHCEHLYTRLAKLGCQIIVPARKPYVRHKPYVHEGVKLIPLPCPRSKSLEAFVHTFLGVFVAKKYGCDLAHFHAVGPSLLVPLARLLKMKVVMTNHGPDYQRKKWGKFAKFVLKTGERLGSRGADAIISISPSISRHIENKYKRDSAFIPNGVIMPEIETSPEILKKYGAEPKKYILSVGRFVPEKGFHDLIDAYDKLQTKEWKLIIVGKADHPDKYSLDLERKAKKNPNIILTGFIKEKPLHEIYSQAGLFVLPSYYEGLPIVLLEAMSYGLSCIASDIPANRDVELLDPQRLFPAGDVDCLAKKMALYMSIPFPDNERIRQLREVAKRFDWDIISKRTLTLYNQVLSIRNSGRGE